MECFEYADLTDLYSRFSTMGMQGFEGITTHKMYDRFYLQNGVHIRIREAHPDYDLSRMAFNKKRWIRFLTEYAPTGLDTFLENLYGSHKLSEVGYLFAHPLHPNSKVDLGGCVIYLSAHLDPTPLISIYSRVSLFLPTSILELSLAALLAERIHDRFPKKPYPQIAWTVTQLQFSVLWGFYWLECNPDQWQYNGAKPCQYYLEMKNQLLEYSQGVRFTYGRRNWIFGKVLEEPQPFIPDSPFLSDYQ